MELFVPYTIVDPTIDYTVPAPGLKCFKISLAIYKRV